MTRRVIRLGGMAVALLVAALLIGACGPSTVPTSTSIAVAPTQPLPEPTQTVPAQPSPAPPTADATQTPLAVGPTQPAATDQPFPPEKPSAVRGQAVFDSNCAACHGKAGDGSGLPGAANFTDASFVRGKTPAQFFRSIRDGITGGAMPAWGDKLTEMEMWDVLYYERAFATSPQQVAQGQALFDENCTTCHGKSGDGSGLPGAANFTDQAFMSAKAPQEFFTSITNGVAGSAMPAWGGKLNEDQIWALVDFVGTFAYEYTALAAEPTAPAPQPSESAAAPTQSPQPVPTETPSLPSTPDPAVGERLWQEKPCKGCHGAMAEGGIGPQLAGTTLNFDEVLLRVRTGKAPMPAFSEQEISDLELQQIYAWLESLTPPTPVPEPTDTPAPTAAGPTATPKPTEPPLPPSGHLMAFWEHVNWVKVHSDFAKDASPDIGALHDRVSKAKAEAQAALQEADLAIADIPNPQAQGTLREVKGFMNQIIQHANAALGTNDFNAARAQAAQMVEISRLDAWPRASLAVKQAGFTGSVLVRVKSQSGSPIAGAFVTALTAPSPSAGRTNSNGQVLIPNLAAVRVMQIKAYRDGVVYHEVHVTVPQGGRAIADITLPGPSAAGQTPSVSNVSVNPSSGAGNAGVTFRMTGVDPQGHDNIAEDQVFALNPDLETAYVLRSAGGDNWQLTVTLPNLSSGTHTWYLFIVDHQCNTSNIIPVTYTVP
jgi:mono/diheme cytochrome c family protein